MSRVAVPTRPNALDPMAATMRPPASAMRGPIGMPCTCSVENRAIMGLCNTVPAICWAWPISSPAINIPGTTRSTTPSSVTTRAAAPDGIRRRTNQVYKGANRTAKTGMPMIPVA